MKSKFGKVIAPIMVLILLAASLIVFMQYREALAVPIGGTYPERLGSFTGPVGGTEQDDNIKASLDLAHTDLDSGLANQEDMISLQGNSTGGVFYVDSGASGTDDGSSWTNACPTANDAIDECTALAGDVVLFAPGHTETLGAGADGVDIDKAGITFRSVGKGLLRAKFDYDTSTDEFVIGAAGDGTVLDGLWFHANTPTVTKAIDVEAACINWTIKNCLFDVETQDTDEFDNAIIVGDASDEGNIIDNEFYMAAGAAVSAIYLDHDADHTRIIGNEVHGDYSTACIVNDTAACEHILIKDNILFNGTDTAGLNTEPGIELVATTSGVIVGNLCICDVATPDLAIVAADCHLGVNHYNENEGTASGAERIGLVPGQTYAAKCTTTTAFAEDLFTVAGGPILITSFVGQVTGAINGDAGNMHIWCDAETTTNDILFSTAVANEGDAIGTLYCFDLDDGQAVFNPQENAGGSTYGNWFCPIGTIEQSNTDADCAGTIIWYMTYVPLVPGVVVTPQ